jgi:ubiquinone/menaquinone biosynthesis C-methylase UbiE
MNNCTYDFDRFTLLAQQQEVQRFQIQDALQPLEDKLLQRANIARADLILDIGCGVSPSTRAMAITYPHSQIIGIDRSHKIIDRARKLAGDLSNLNFQIATVDRLNLADNCVDLVFARLLFQHLDRPLTALAEIYRVLKPGGTICILDTDDGWFTLYPEPTSFDRLRRTMATWQQSQGGDSSVGRKLGGYLQQAKFIDIHVSVETVSSDEYGLETMLNWLSFGNPYINISPEIADIFATARTDSFELLNLPYAWAAWGLFMAIANKKIS